MLHRGNRLRHLRYVWTATAVAAALAILLIAAALPALSLRRHLISGARHLQAAQTVLERATTGGESFQVSLAGLDHADAELVGAQAEFGQAGDDLNRLGPALALAQRLPVTGGAAAAVPHLIEFATLATTGGRDLIAGLRPVALERDAKSSDAPAIARLSTALISGEPALTRAQRQFELAQQQRSAIDEQSITPRFRRSLAPLAQWDRRWPVLRDDIAVLQRLPAVAISVLGYDAPKRYAILGQNSAELRPTGGFLGTMGTVAIAKGQIAEQDYRSIYTYEPAAIAAQNAAPPAPAPLIDHLGITGWHIQDANWSPDFPTSSRDLRAFLDHDTGVRVDGVIGFDSYAVQQLLQALGPVDVTLDGKTDHFTADNWLNLTTQLVFLDPQHPDATEGKNRVLAPLLRTVITRVNAVSGDQLTALLQGLRQSVAQRHILFQFDAPVAQRFVYDYGADGGVRQRPGETLIYPVEANLSYTKIGPFIQQTATYELWFGERGVCTRARVSLQWRNTVTPAQMADPVNRITGAQWDAANARLIDTPGAYGLYERLYLPQGAALTNTEGGDEPVGQTRDGNFAVFGTYLSIPAGDSRRLDFDLTLPDREASPGHFALSIPKQPGTQGREVRVVLHTTGGLHPLGEPAPDSQEGTTFLYRRILDQSLRFEVRLGR